MRAAAGNIRWRGRFAPHLRIAAAAASYELPLSRKYRNDPAWKETS